MKKNIHIVALSLLILLCGTFAIIGTIGFFSSSFLQALPYSLLFISIAVIITTGIINLWEMTIGSIILLKKEIKKDAK